MLLQQAVNEDPNYALAYSMMADVQAVLMDARNARHDTLLAEADRYASQAVALGPDLPDAQLSVGWVRQTQWRWTDAESAYLRALALAPRSARAHRWYGGLLLQYGRFDQSLELYRRSIDIDPYDFPGQSGYGHALFHAGRAREAAAQLEALLAQKDLLAAHTNCSARSTPTWGGLQPAEGEAYLRKALEQSEIIRRQEGKSSDDARDTDRRHGRGARLELSAGPVRRGAVRGAPRAGSRPEARDPVDARARSTARRATRRGRWPCCWRPRPSTIAIFSTSTSPPTTQRSARIRRSAPWSIGCVSPTDPTLTTPSRRSHES